MAFLQILTKEIKAAIGKRSGDVQNSVCNTDFGFYKNNTDKKNTNSSEPCGKICDTNR